MFKSLGQVRFLFEFKSGFIWSKYKVQGSRFFIIRHIHDHTSIISSEMQVEFKKNTAFTVYSTNTV